MAAAFNFFPTFLICESVANIFIAADSQININEDLKKMSKEILYKSATPMKMINEPMFG
jgi:hypothetical protein